QITSARVQTQRGTNFTRAEFKFSGAGTYNFFNLSAPGKFSEKEMPSAQPLVEAVTNFEDLLAVFQVREARARPAQPPSIAMLEPAGAEEGKAVETSRSLRVRGLASHASGIASVIVNGQPAFLKPMTPQTAEFDARDLPLNAGGNAVMVLATATDKTTARLSFQVAKAEVRLLSPLPGFESQEPVVNVRGRASGFGEIQSIEVAGVRARLSPQSDGTTEFEAEKVPLRVVGTNTLEGVVAAASGIREPFQFEVRRKQPLPPTLSITSKPGAVQVYVDDEPRGITSAGGKLVLKDLPTGSHRLRLSVSGYQDWEQTLDLVAGGNHTVEANLAPAGPPPFTLQDVVDMLQGEISALRVAALVQERGVDFALTDEAETKIRAAGGDSDLLLAIARARR
ncbi:MAG: PEGA domain-containing protein, partial [Terriglobales bacterium]